MSEGWPDFWIKGKYIELIDTINTVNLIKTIQQIDNITNLGTLDTINTVGTIQKINPTETENVVIDRIAKIDNVTNLGTLDTLNTIGTIQKINPQNTDNVVIDRLKLLNLIETINTIQTINNVNLIKRIGSINFANISRSFVVNGSFESGDLTGWYRFPNEISQTNAYVTDEMAYDGIYSLKYICDDTPETATPEVDQIVGYIPVEEIDFIRCKMYAEAGTILRFQAYYSDGTSDMIDKTVTITGWNTFVVKGSSLTAGKELFQFGIYPAQESENANKTFYLDAVIGFLRVQTAVHQVEKDRTITDITKVSSIHSFDVSASGSGNNAIWTPASGKAIRLKLVQYESDADVEVGLRFGDSGSLFARRITKGVMALNLVGCNVQGAVDEVLNLYTAGAVNVKGFVLGEEI